MRTYEWTPNFDSETNPLEEVFGRRAVYTSAWDGTRRVGVLEPHPRGGIYALIRFEDGTCGRADETIELVKEESDRMMRRTTITIVVDHDDDVSHEDIESLADDARVQVEDPREESNVDGRHLRIASMTVLTDTTMECVRRATAAVKESDR